MADEKQDPPYDKTPRQLCRDPVLGTRADWAWCPRCGGIQPPGHSHPPPSCNRHLDCDTADRNWHAHGIQGDSAEHCTSSNCQPMCCPPACPGDLR